MKRDLAVRLTVLQATDCRTILGTLVTDADVMIDLLLDVQPAAADAAHRAPKRAKTDRYDFTHSSDGFY